MCNNNSDVIEQLDIKETPLEILEVLSKRRWPVSGGWGYSREDAVIDNITQMIPLIAHQTVPVVAR